MFDLHEALSYVVQQEGSDLHVKVPARPMARFRGQLEPLPHYSDPLAPADTERVLRQMLADHSDKMAAFDSHNEIDFSYTVDGLARFRVNAFRQRGSVSIVARVIPFTVKTIDELGLPQAIESIADEERGLILLTGTTGSGKSTTLAAIINHINNTMARHIVTIEDPIEYLHRDKKSIINQREVGMDTESFGRAMRRVLRQDPDVILIGEMRDEETVRTALSAAETGHLVLSTVHTLDAAESVNRIIDFFQPHEQSQARAMLAGTLRAVVSQRLVRTADHTSRVAVCEILRMTGRARDMILDPDQTDRLREVIAEGEYYGMQTFDQALLSHFQAGRVSMEDALRVASSPHDFKLLVAGEGRTATSMDDLIGSGDRNGSGSDAGDADGAPARDHPGGSPEPAPVQQVRPPQPIASANGRPSAPPPGMAA
ncbi:MAG TPA: type IV pilus twitching motility protein PilT [Solirubrobacteraceae bacterium]|jgi:twitching motility protein PilT|nr:type IV pilus twitching motility protein PilT [Solirubrobacteraceae bacterium]